MGRQCGRPAAAERRTRSRAGADERGRSAARPLGFGNRAGLERRAAERPATLAARPHSHLRRLVGRRRRAVHSRAPDGSGSSIGPGVPVGSASSVGSRVPVGCGSSVWSGAPVGCGSRVPGGSAFSVGSGVPGGCGSSVGSRVPVGCGSRVPGGCGSSVWSGVPVGSGSSVGSGVPVGSGSSVGSGVPVGSGSWLSGGFPGLVSCGSGVARAASPAALGQAACVSRHRTRLGRRSCRAAAAFARQGYPARACCARLVQPRRHGRERDGKLT